MKKEIDKLLNIVFLKASDHEEQKKPGIHKPARRPVMHIETGQKYDSMTDAARAYNIDKSSLRRNLMNIYKTNKYPFKFI